MGAWRDGVSKRLSVALLPPKASQPMEPHEELLVCPETWEVNMFWHLGLVAAILVTFGGVLFALCTDRARLPTE